MSSAVTTYSGRAKRALLHKQNCTYWMAIGRTTPWSDEQAPPDAAPGATAMEEAIIFVKADTVQLCKAVSSNPDVTHLGQGYAFVAEGDAIAQLARFLYLKAEFHPAQGQPSGDFRQIGVYSDLVPAAGHENDLWLAPADVTSPGTLEYVANDVMTAMSVNRYEVMPIIIEFR